MAKKDAFSTQKLTQRQEWEIIKKDSLKFQKNGNLYSLKWKCFRDSLPRHHDMKKDKRSEWNTQIF